MTSTRTYMVQARAMQEQLLNDKIDLSKPLPWSITRVELLAQLRHLVGLNRRNGALGFDPKVRVLFDDYDNNLKARHLNKTQKVTIEITQPCGVVTSFWYVQGKDGMWVPVEPRINLSKIATSDVINRLPSEQTLTWLCWQLSSGSAVWVVADVSKRLKVVYVNSELAIMHEYGDKDINTIATFVEFLIFADTSGRATILVP